VIVKAVAGGGGRGMRVVRNARNWHGAANGAAESEAAFGVGDVYIEKYSRIRATSNSRSSAITRQRACIWRARMLDPAPPSEAARRVALARR
jgi:hypothetical protein